MSRKKTAAKSAAPMGTLVVTESGDPMDIPAFLRRQKDEPARKVNGVIAVADAILPSRRRFEVPMGMTNEEYDAMKAKLEPIPAPKPVKPAPETSTAPVAGKDPPKERKAVVKREPAPSGTFKLIDWARKSGHDPKAVRRAARANKGEIAKLQVNGLKYVFSDKSKDAVAKIIVDGMANESKRKVKVKGEAPAPVVTSSRKVKVPPPSETIWSSQAKKAKPAPEIKAVSPKADARKEARKAVREVGKRNITKVAPAKHK